MKFDDFSEWFTMYPNIIVLFTDGVFGEARVSEVVWAVIGRSDCKLVNSSTDWPKFNLVPVGDA